MEELGKLVAELKPYLQESNYKALECLAPLRDHLNRLDLTTEMMLEDQVDQLDFQRARETLVGIEKERASGERTG